jgi:hypothetical protein
MIHIAIPSFFSEIKKLLIITFTIDCANLTRFRNSFLPNEVVIPLNLILMLSFMDCFF